MPTFECVCGYSCGSAKAWARHESRNNSSDSEKAAHQLRDPSLLPQATAPAENDLSDDDLLRRSLVPANQQKCRRDFALTNDAVVKSLDHGSMPLINACRHGDVARLTSLLSAVPPPTVAELARCDAAGMSAMAWAAKTGRLELIRALLAAGASPNLLATDADTSEAHPPLYLALTKGRFDAASLLLDAKALPCEPEPVRQQTALHAACTTDAPLQ